MLKNNLYKIIFRWAPFIVIILFLHSCTSTKQLTYFNDLPDSTVVHLPPVEQEERIIQKLDRLQITIGARNAEVAAIFNTYGGIPTSGAPPTISGTGQQEITGYLVDYDGNVEFPFIGKIKAQGLTTNMLKDTLTALLKPYLKEPLVNVRFFQFKFTVLGEVRAPGTFNLSIQRTTLLDALGAAGDLPRSAKRSDIKIYRDYNGERTVTKIDLRKKDILNDPKVFQVKNNDVIYVQPRERKVFTEDFTFYLSVFTAVGTILALLRLSR